MSRWSLSKAFTEVSAKDFCEAVQNMQESMQTSCNTEIGVSIKFYSAMKHSITQIIDGVNEHLAKQNEKKVFAEVTKPELITDALWRNSVYVEANFHPVKEDQAPQSTYANIEALGLKGKTITFYAQPDDISNTIEQASKKHFRTWRRGNGRDSNHIVTLG